MTDVSLCRCAREVVEFCAGASFCREGDGNRAVEDVCEGRDGLSKRRTQIFCLGNTSLGLCVSLSPAPHFNFF